MHLINHLPTPVLHQISLFQSLFGQLPSYSHSSVFGSPCFIHLPPNEFTKLTYQAARCAFIGYSVEHKGFLCYDHEARRTRVSVCCFSGTHSLLFSPI